MTRQILLGSAVALMVAGPVSALTMTLLEDDRFTDVKALAGNDSDFDSDAPDFPFVVFESEISAQAADFGAFDTLNVASGVPGFGATASATASQTSKITDTTIEISGSATAEGSHGDQFPAGLQGGGGVFGFEPFRANAESFLEVIFSIDEAAVFDLEGFLLAGTEIAAGDIGNEVNNFAFMSLHNEDTDESVFDFEVSDDFVDINESGVIGPGKYRFSAGATAEVFAGLLDEVDSAGDAENQIQQDGYQTGARFGGIGLKLIAADQPIPEPVTTTLAAMGLGALVLRTSRRHRQV